MDILKGYAIPTLLATLKECGKRKDLGRGEALHTQIVNTGCHANNYVANALVTMYSKCRSMRNARYVFDSMDNRDVVSWTSLIQGYVENGESSVAIDLFQKMDCEPNFVTFGAALKACTSLVELDTRYVEIGMCIHRQAKERGVELERKVATGFIEMYSNCGYMDHAREIFDRMLSPDVVAWTTLVLGYVENGESLVALDLLIRMNCEPDCVTYVAALKACTGLAVEKESERELYLEKGMAVHKLVKECRSEVNITVAGTLLEMYSKCRSMTDAQDVFDKMVCRDVVCWNTLILGYVENAESFIAMNLFMSMDCEPDSITFVAALKACASLVAMAAGKRIHAQICKLGLERNVVMDNCLVDFYGKCSFMSISEHVFNSMSLCNVVSWNTLIAGYATVGETHEVFRLVKDMQEGGFQMDDITFMLVLTACSHGGMVDEAQKCFGFIHTYGINPNKEHYTCIIDMLGRANRVQEALTIIKSMPFEADNVAWTSLLSSCKNFNNVEVSKVACDIIIQKQIHL